MLVKICLYADDKLALRDKLAELFAPFDNASTMVSRDDLVTVGPHVLAYYENDGTLKDVSYWSMSKTETFSNGNRSLALLKIDKSYLEAMVNPLVDAGVIEILGGVVNGDESVSELFSAEDWQKVQLINSKWGTIEDVMIFDTPATIEHGFIDIA